jgi:hypothetical protein
MGILGLVLAFLVRGALAGVLTHASDPVGPTETDMASYRKVIDTVLYDAGERNNTHVTFAGSTLIAFHSVGVQNVLIFEYGFRPYGGMLHRGKNSAVEFDQLFQPGAAVELRSLEPDAPKPKGAEPTPEELLAIKAVEEKRINKLVARANEELDYIVFPDDKTITFSETQFYARRNYSNLISRRVRDRVLASGTWEPLGGQIQISPNEVGQIYANRRGVPSPATQPAR